MCSPDCVSMTPVLGLDVGNHVDLGSHKVHASEFQLGLESHQLANPFLICPAFPQILQLLPKTPQPSLGPHEATSLIFWFLPGKVKATGCEQPFPTKCPLGALPASSQSEGQASFDFIFSHPILPPPFPLAPSFQHLKVLPLH